MKIKYNCLQFKELTLEELYAIMNIRQEVFVVEQNCPYIDADNLDQMCYHVLGRNEEGKIVAYTRLVPKGGTYENYISIGRVINHMSIRGKGIGRELMIKSLEYCKEIWGDKPIKISAQVYLLKFYNSLGFVEVGEGYDEDGIPHWGMILK